MAKLKNPTAARGAKSDRLLLRLFDPGMSILHRAGLGGLACTLSSLERAFRDGEVGEDEVPGGPWADDRPPWNVECLGITLEFGAPENAGEYLRRLFAWAFQLKDGLIYLPGQYYVEPDVAVRAELQSGLTLTFLQHGQVRQLSKEETVLTYSVDEKPVTLSMRSCLGYKHQEGWKDLCDGKGRLSSKPVEITGSLNPGAVVRHVAYGAQTRIEESPAGALPLYFALVGCLALPVNRGSGVLLVPEVTDLRRFARLRPRMTPRSVPECRITGAGDAVLQAEVRLKAQAVAVNDIPGCYAATFEPTPWASQQKSRIKSLYVSPLEPLHLEQFEVAMAELPPRLLSRAATKNAASAKVSVSGKNRSKRKPETPQEEPDKEWFWADSVVRPLVADNLAQGRRWYEGFAAHMRQIEPGSKKPFSEKVRFERKGLHAMTEKIPWEDRGEKTVVEAVHEALRRRYGVIAHENKGNPVAMEKRWSGEYDRWRLAFSGAKTVDQFRRSFCELLSRAGVNPVLQEDWRTLLPMLSNDRWSLTRDLALVALASYKGAGEKDFLASDSEVLQIEASSIDQG